MENEKKDLFWENGALFWENGSDAAAMEDTLIKIDEIVNENVVKAIKWAISEIDVWPEPDKDNGDIILEVWGPEMPPGIIEKTQSSLTEALCGQADDWDNNKVECAIMVLQKIAQSLKARIKPEQTENPKND